MHYDLLVKIKNADHGEKDSFTTSFSKLDFSVAKILAEAGYIKDVQKKTAGRKSFIEIKLARGRKKPVINGLKIISKPSRRIYVGKREIKAVKQGYGLGVISTPNGILSNTEAKKQGVGGEYLFQIW